MVSTKQHQRVAIMLLPVLVCVVSMSNSTFALDSNMDSVLSSAVSEPSAELLCPPGSSFSTLIPITVNAIRIQMLCVMSSKRHHWSLGTV